MAASWLPQTIRDHLLYGSGYLQGRTSSIPRSLGGLYAWVIAKATRLALLPLPLVSFLAIPFYGGTSTTLNLLFFYMTWSALVLSHDPLTVEIYGTLAVRLLFFLLPALTFVTFDCLVPSLSRSVKARGARHLPLGLGWRKIRHVIVTSLGNVLLTVIVQAMIEIGMTDLLHGKRLLRVTTAVPLPWNIAKDVFHGFVWRGILRYIVHRYILHGSARWPFKKWHSKWQHSIRLPFSLVAAYDHPFNHLLSQWLPAFLPAIVFKFHILTWHILVAIISIEDLMAYSGYDVLPSSILMTSMARRTDAHFEATSARPLKAGNFGQLGILDFCCGTAIRGQDDLANVILRESEKHNARERIIDAAAGLREGLMQDGSEDEADVRDEPGLSETLKQRFKSGGRRATASNSERHPAQGDDSDALDATQGAVKRQGLRRRAAKT